MNYHTSVLLQEAVEGLNVKTGHRYIDATFGGGGHTRLLLEQGAVVLGIDTDEDAIRQSRSIQNASLHVVQGNFRDIKELAEAAGFVPVSGILFDLGVSSHQLDEEERGFSYRFPDAPFDLRLNQRVGKPASEYINHESKEQLEAIIGTYGEEEHCRLIADFVGKRRVKHPINTTGDVLSIIEQAVGPKIRNETASRVFQAFRILVNDELASLKMGLSGAAEILEPGGRLAVISFHSLEDRIVKQFLLKGPFEVLTKKPIIPKESELDLNRRSRSAKLRIAKKI